MIGWCTASKWAVACRSGELSQQPTWLQLWHTRRCTQSCRPRARQSSHPVDAGATAVIWSTCVQVSPATWHPPERGRYSTLPHWHKLGTCCPGSSKVPAPDRRTSGPPRRAGRTPRAACPTPPREAGSSDSQRCPASDTGTRRTPAAGTPRGRARAGTDLLGVRTTSVDHACVRRWRGGLPGVGSQREIEGAPEELHQRTPAPEASTTSCTPRRPGAGIGPRRRRCPHLEGLPRRGPAASLGHVVAR